MSYHTVAPPMETKFKKDFKKSKKTMNLNRFLSKVITNNYVNLPTQLGWGTAEEVRVRNIHSTMAVDEFHWNDCGRVVIFLESKEFVDAIMNSKFDVEAINNLPPISESFYLVLPKGVTNNQGVELPNTIVSWDKKSKDSEARQRDIISYAHSSTGGE